ncbi:MAG: tetratricopeptide repeat protein [Nitrosomonadales bacterium]|nr:tetratricopeptide repeat protein [Nitrosomonadales bacterium]
MSKPGRNDLCPCGSGKKYKQCCQQRKAPATSGGPDAAALQAALEHHRAGRLPQAQAIYQQILQAEPDHPDALHYLGAIASGEGRHRDAADLIGKAVRIRPSRAMHYNLGNALKALGELDGAAESYREALALKPDYAEAHVNLGNTLQAQGKLEEAIGHYRSALLSRPDLADAHVNLGNALRAQDRLEEAAESYRRALALRPDHAETHFHLGLVSRALDNLDEAVACYRKALALKPDYAEAYNNLGIALRVQGKPDEAIEQYHKALALKPDYAEAFSNLGSALKNQGHLDEAIEYYRRALALKPDFVDAYSNLLFSMQFSSNYSLAELFAEHLRFAAQYEAPLKPLRKAHRNSPDPQRRLKVGYVSADFYRHAAAFFIEPVLANHDKSRVEVYCYYNNTRRDELTERIAGYADHWVPCRGLSDDQLAERIRSDGIDILVDLSGHTAGNRMLMFARKPAPLQVTYLGYPGTSGLSAMDYRITDRYADPEENEAYYSEKLIRLPDSLCCYRPTGDMPEVAPLPALQNGYITFGSLNNFNKVSDQCIELWSALLRAVPTSRLLMLTVPEGTAREQLIGKFAGLGISAERLELHGKFPSREFHQMFRRVDIALDPFPVTGGTTTCETLWMGVPVIVLVGQRYISRVGYSFLSAAGLRDFAAHTHEDYIKVATRMGGNIPLLAEIHDGLRARMAASPLCGEAAFTRNLENAYREMWAKWCNAAT